MADSGRILSIDYGTRRVGLAMSDPTRSIAFPLKTIDLKKSRESIETRIASLAVEHEISLLVVGLPVTERGDKGERAREVEEFISRLKPMIECGIVTWDERYTSARAERAIHELGEKIGRDKGKVDRIAAVFILQNYLDSVRGGLT